MRSTKICRLCGCSVSFGYNIFSKRDGIDFQDLIIRYVNIEVTKDDSLSLKICEECRSTLKSFNAFVDKCLKTQESFTKFSENEKILPARWSAIAQCAVKLEKIEDDQGLDAEETYSDNFIEDKIDDVKFEDIKSNNESLDDKDVQIQLKMKKMFLSKKRTRCNNPDNIKKYTLKKKSKDSYGKKGRPLKHDYSVLNYSCHICDLNFDKWGPLNDHTLSQHKQKGKVICICKAELSCYSALRKHVMHHSVYDKQLFCKECSEQFYRRKEYKNHMRIVHQDDAYMFKCHSCDLKFVKIALLKKHSEKHLPKELTHPHRCDKCEKIYKSQHELIIHIRGTHENDPSLKYSCDLCGKVFNHKNTLVAHMHVHLGIKLFKCSKCSKGFRSKELLEAHKETHKGIKYRCTECSEILSSIKTFRTHKLVHQEVLKYKCRFCEKKYKRRPDKVRHENRHLGITPYACPWCPKKFVDNSHLRNHKKTCHPKELADYEAIHGVPFGVRKKIEDVGNYKIIPLSLNTTLSSTL